MVVIPKEDAHHCMGFNAIDEYWDWRHSLSFHGPNESREVRLSGNYMLAVEQNGHYWAALVCFQGSMPPIPTHVLLWGLEVASVVWMKTACIVSKCHLASLLALILLHPTGLTPPQGGHLPFADDLCSS